MATRKKIVPEAYSVPDGVSAEVLRGKDDWNTRAKEDPFHWTVNSQPVNGWDFQAYMDSGEATLNRWLDPLAANGTLRFPLGVVCEIGSGAGRISQALSRRATKVIGMDISGEMVKAAKANMKKLDITNVTFREGNGYNLDVFKDGEADTVVSVICFQHIPSSTVQMEYLREVNRVLKPGGQFLISLYDDQKAWAQTLAMWSLKREAGDAGDWGAEAQAELTRFETSMCTPMGLGNMSRVMEETGMQLLWHHGKGTDQLWIAGQKPA